MTITVTKNDFHLLELINENAKIPKCQILYFWKKPIYKPDGYRIYQHRGYMNGKIGYFEIGVTPNNNINHRFFRPIKY